MSKNYNKIIGTLFACLCVASMSLQPVALTAKPSSSSSGRISYDYQKTKLPPLKLPSRATIFSTSTRGNTNIVKNTTQQRYITLLNSRYNLNSYGTPKNTVQKTNTSTQTTSSNNYNSGQQRYINLLNNYNRSSINRNSYTTNTTSTPKTTQSNNTARTSTPKTQTTSSNNYNSGQQRYISLLNNYNRSSINRNSYTTNTTSTPKTTQSNNTARTSTPKTQTTSSNNYNSGQQRYISLLNNYNRSSINRNSYTTNTTSTPKTTQSNNTAKTSTPKTQTTQSNNTAKTSTPKISYTVNRQTTTKSYPNPKTTSAPKNTNPKTTNNTAYKTTSAPKNTTPKTASSSRSIKSTDIKWVTMPIKNSVKNKTGSGKVVWGGGSLHQLIGRLAIEGCNVDRIQIGSYSYQDTGNNNATFLNRYKNNITKNTVINITCIDNCSVLKGPGHGATSQRQRCKERNAYAEKKYASINLNTPCGDYFSSFARTNVLTRLPIFQDTCITKYTIPATSSGNISSAKGFTFSPMRIANGKMYQNYTTGIYINQRKANLKTEIHELCHVNQSWYTQKMFMDNTQIAKSIGKIDSNAFHDAWYETPAGREFIRMTGQQRSTTGETRNNRIMWHLPSNSYLKQMSNNYTPHELAAEACALYFLKDTDPLAAALLTPRMEAYIEKYFVLPRV